MGPMEPNDFQSAREICRRRNERIRSYITNPRVEPRNRYLTPREVAWRSKESSEGAGEKFALTALLRSGPKVWNQTRIQEQSKLRASGAKAEIQKLAVTASVSETGALARRRARRRFPKRKKLSKCGRFPRRLPGRANRKGIPKGLSCGNRKDCSVKHGSIARKRDWKNQKNQKNQSDRAEGLGIAPAQKKLFQTFFLFLKSSQVFEFFQTPLPLYRGRVSSATSVASSSFASSSLSLLLSISSAAP